MKRYFVFLIFCLTIIFTGCMSFKSASENIWIDEDFKLNEGDIIYIILKNDDTIDYTNANKAIISGLLNAKVIKSKDDETIISSFEEIVPSKTGKTYFIDYKSVVKQTLVKDYRYGFYYDTVISLFDINIYDYDTKKLVASNYCDDTLLGQPNVTLLHVLQTVENLMKAVLEK